MNTIHCEAFPLLHLYLPASDGFYHWFLHSFIVWSTDVVFSVFEMSSGEESERRMTLRHGTKKDYNKLVNGGVDV